MMLGRVRQLLKTHVDRDHFFRLVARRFPEHSAEYQLIVKAYDTAKDAFRGRTRESNGERYFEHLRAVALIVMEYLRVSDANVIAAALLHDLPEDIVGWGQDRMAREFNAEVAQYVW